MQDRAGQEITMTVYKLYVALETDTGGAAASLQLQLIANHKIHIN